MVQIERDSNNVIINRKITNINQNIKNNPDQLGVIGKVILNSIKLKGTTVVSDTIDKLSYAKTITPGIASAGKTLLVDTNKDIDGLNVISCNSLNLRNVPLDITLYTSNSNINTGENYIEDINIGSASPNKALVLDYNYNIDNINNLETKYLQLNKKNIGINCSDNICINDLTYIETDIINSNWVTSVSKPLLYDIVSFGTTYVAVGEKIFNSIDGIKWVECFSSTDIYKSITCGEVNGILTLIALGNSTIVYSNDSIHWTSINIYNNNWKSIYYANSIFICVGESMTMWSIDCLNWNMGTLNCDIKQVEWCHNIFIGIGDSNIYTSVEGKKWNLIMTDSELKYLCFSPLLNRVIISSGNGYVIYSDDSQTWSNSYENKVLNIITWASELELFIGLNENNGYYSKDGLSWKIFEYGDMIINSIIWSSYYEKIIGVGEGIINSCLSKKNNSLNKLFINTNGDLGLGNNTNTNKLEIYDSSGKCLKLRSNDNITTFDVNNKILTIESSTYLNLNSGLKLNNSLVTTDVFNFNKYLNNITPGTVVSNSVLTSNNNRNVTIGGSINTLTLTVNGVSKDINSNNILFRNVKAGIASPSKGLVLDYKNDINNINLYSTNNLSINNSLLKSNNSINIDNLNNLLLTPKYTDNILSTTIGSTFSSTGNKILCINDVFILCNNNGIYYSKNSIDWVNIISGVYNDINYNGELILAVGDNIIGSFDGIYWNIISDLNSESITLNSICRSKDLNQYLVSGANIIGVSNDGYNWSFIEINHTFIKVCAIGDLYMGITNINDNNLCYISTDCIVWQNISYSSNIIKTDILYENNIIYICTNAGIMYSKESISIWDLISDSIILTNINYINNVYFGVNDDGIYSSNDCMNWQLYFELSSTNKSNVIYSDNYGCLCLFDDTGFVRNECSLDIFSKCLYLYPEHIITNNNRIGLGIDPQYTLQLSTDNAASTSSTWAVSSDERLKENIINANLSTCTYIIKSLRLVKYKWKIEEIKDKNKLGWIAQEVEEFIPEAISITNQYEYDDFKSLDIDQIIANLYGASQRLIDLSEINKNLCHSIESMLNDIIL